MPIVNKKTKQELGFHDDTLLSMNMDLEKMSAILRIQTHEWVENENKEAKETPTESKKQVRGEIYRARKSKIAVLELKLTEGVPYFEGELSTAYPGNAILWADIINKKLFITFVLGDLVFSIDEYSLKYEEK